MYPELMDSTRKSVILPSNAPDNLEHHFSSRGVLQNTSGNVQTGTLENGEIMRDTSLPTAAKGICAVYPSQASRTTSCKAAISTYRRRARLREPFRTSSGNDKLTKLTPEQARWYRERMTTTGGLPILTRSELRCEAYLKYRARQRKNLGSDGEPVWSDHMEEAFQRGTWRLFPLSQLSFMLTTLQRCGRSGHPGAQSSRCGRRRSGKAATSGYPITSS